MTTNISYLAARLRELHSKLRNTFEFMDGALAAEAADALQQQAERITAQDVKCRLYEASLEKADAEIEGLKRDNASLLKSVTGEASEVDRLQLVLSEVAALKRSRKRYLDKPSGSTATVNIPLTLLERIDAISQGEPK